MSPTLYCVSTQGAFWAPLGTSHLEAPSLALTFMSAPLFATHFGHASGVLERLQKGVRLLQDGSRLQKASKKLSLNIGTEAIHLTHLLDASSCHKNWTNSPQKSSQTSKVQVLGSVAQTPWIFAGHVSRLLHAAKLGHRWQSHRCRRDRARLSEMDRAPSLPKRIRRDSNTFRLIGPSIEH